MSATPGPGYYQDPNDPSVDRYWDGDRWTDNRVPRAPAPQVQVQQPEKEQEASGVVVAGYAFAVLMPLIGFIIGLTQINKSRHGIWVVIVSVVAFIVWLAIIGASADSGSTGSSDTYSY